MADRAHAHRRARRDPRHADGAAPDRGGQLDGRVPQLRHHAGDGGRYAAELHHPSARARGRHLPAGVLEAGVNGARARQEGMDMSSGWASRAVRAAACGLAAMMLGLSGAAADPFRIIITETEIPLVPNSVIDLAGRLGFYKQAGVDVELVRVAQTPSAVAALHSGQGQMANIGLDAALQLIARGQMKLKGVISPDKALPFLLV